MNRVASLLGGSATARALAVSTRDDPALLGHLRESRDAAAIAEIVRRHAGLVLGACRRRLPGDQAERVCEAVLSDLIADPMRVSGSLPVWLHRQVLARSAPAAGATTSGTVGDWSQVAPLLDGALADLPADDRDRLLSRFCCLPPRVSEGRTLRRGDEDRLASSLDALAHRLARDGVTITVETLSAALEADAIEVPMGGLAGRLGRLALAALPTGNSTVVDGVEKRFRLYVGLAITLLVIVLIGGAVVWGIALFGPKKAESAAPQR